jgi:hypothetical protein
MIGAPNQGTHKVQLTEECRFAQEKCGFPTDPQIRFVPIKPLDKAQGIKRLELNDAECSVSLVLQTCVASFPERTLRPGRARESAHTNSQPLPDRASGEAEPEETLTTIAS